MCRKEDCITQWLNPIIYRMFSLVSCPVRSLCIILTNITFNPLVRIYTYEIPKPLRLKYVYIYVHGICDRNMGLLPASNRHFTVSTHEVFTCFRSAASISRHVYQVGRKVEFTRSCPLFLASFGKLRLSDQVQFIAWYGIQRRIIWIFCRESEVSG